MNPYPIRLALAAVALVSPIAVTAESTADPGDTPLNAPAHLLNQADREALRQDDDGLQVVTLADGSTMVDLQGRYQLAATAATDADGHVHQNCVTGHDIEQAGIPVPVPVAGPEER